MWKKKCSINTMTNPIFFSLCDKWKSTLAQLNAMKQAILSSSSWLMHRVFVLYTWYISFLCTEDLVYSLQSIIHVNNNVPLTSRSNQCLVLKRNILVWCKTKGFQRIWFLGHYYQGSHHSSKTGRSFESNKEKFA